MRLPSLLLLAALAATGSAQPAPPTDPLAPLFAPALGDTRAALLLRDGRVIEKRYAPGYSDATRFISWSMNKTATGLLVGALVADGRLELDAPAPLDEWRGADDPRSKITLRQLLNMSSGLRHVEVGDPIEASDTNQVLFVTGTQAMAAAAMAQPLATPPGSRWEYSSLTSLLLAEIVTRTLTPSRDPHVRAAAYTQFAEERLFGPAGIGAARFEFDGAGTQIGGSLLYMTLDDWGRLGQLLIDGRGPDGRQAVAPAWLDFMRRPAATAGNYGGQLWLNRSAQRGRPVMFAGAPETTISAEGHLGQHVTVVPEARLVVVRLGNTPEADIDGNHAAIGRIIAGQLHP
ncbi:serine hydrolase domain-containing protein [Sphingomonas sp.]|uniref:serine hydrolase domain-containing protein n=1 Tax=Sphingomonas sp. TaxID=28214 RepID=UPI003CC5FD98